MTCLRLGWEPVGCVQPKYSQMCMFLFLIWLNPILGRRFGYFYFFLLGEGEGGVRGARRGGGCRLLIEDRRRGVSRRGGAEGPGGRLRRIGELRRGGGLNIFFRGRNVHQVYDNCTNLQPEKSLRPQRYSRHFPWRTLKTLTTLN